MFLCCRWNWLHLLSFPSANTAAISLSSLCVEKDAFSMLACWGIWGWRQSNDRKNTWSPLLITVPWYLPPSSSIVLSFRANSRKAQGQAAAPQTSLRGERVWHWLFYNLKGQPHFFKVLGTRTICNYSPQNKSKQHTPIHCIV